MNTIVPIVLLLIAIIWAWATFSEPIKRFYEWIKGMTTSGKDRFQKQITTAKEFTYS